MTTKVTQDDTDSNEQKPNLKAVLNSESDISSWEINVWDDGISFTFYFTDGGTYTTDNISHWDKDYLQRKGVIPEGVE